MTERSRLKKRNLDAIGDRWPELGRRLKAFTPASKLVVDRTGEADVEIAGQRVYGRPFADVVAEQITQFWDVGPNRFIVDKPDPADKDEHTNRMLHRVLTRATKAGITFGFGPTERRSYFLAVLGIGLGRHIDALVETTDCQVLLIADKDLEFLAHSLQVYDWENLFGRMEAGGGRVRFIIEAKPERLSEQLRVHLRNDNPCAVDGFACFIHDRNPSLTGAIEDFVKNLNLILFGLGFFYDETLMLRNAYGNLGSGRAKIYRRLGGTGAQTPALVVATGPSLDQSIDFIRENQGRAVVISSGTALRALLINGIAPDFHIEMENISVFPIIKQVIGEHDLSSICLIAATTVDQSITEHFGDVAFFHRATLSPYPLFGGGDENTLRFPDPTVVNTSLSFALECGFPEIYLFGVDMGGPKGGKHHSADSYHYTDDAIVIDSDLDFKIEVEGNFGGTFITSNDLYVTRDILATMLRLHGKGRRVFNCSDGARIEGARPKRADHVTLADIPGGKAGVVGGIVAAFPVFTRDAFERAWDEAALVAAVERFTGKLTAWIDGADDLDDKAYLTRLMALIPPKIVRDRLDMDPVDETITMLFRGTLIMMATVIEYYLVRVTDSAKRAAFQDIVRDEMAAAIATLRDVAIARISNPGEVPDPEGTGDTAAKNIVPEAPHTWGRVARNAACPCGSGRKYKHCHGQKA